MNACRVSVNAETRTIAVCIATFRRAAGLARLMQALQSLDMRGSYRALLVEVIIVDNDPAGSASTLVEQLSVGSRWPITYVWEPRQGIPFARNAAVRRAIGGGADAIAWIDDDEVPDSAWLMQLSLAMDLYTADIVAGPVLPVFEASVPPWILSGKFFDRPRLRTGERLDRARAGNILMRTDVFVRVGRLFDERFLLQGEDTDFFLHAVAIGCKIVWADDAIVQEWIPENRIRLRWLLTRAYRIGVAWGQYRIGAQPNRNRALRNLTKGLLWLPISVVQGRSASVRALHLIATGVGYLISRWDANR